MPLDWYNQAGKLVKLEKVRKQSDALVRPQIAKLYKAGVIAPYHDPPCAGRAYAAAHPLTVDETIFIDYRETARPVTEQGLAGTTDWLRFDLPDNAKKYRVNKPDARFALLRVWSQSNSWPLTVGYDKEREVSLEDPQK